MVDPFFSLPNGRDEEYRTLATSDWPPAADARAFVQDIWPRVAPYLDSEFASKAARNFHPHFWELYLVASLQAAGLQLIPRAQRKGSDEGPDVLLTTGGAIEAVIAMPGVGPDAVTEGALGIARSVPDPEIRLRLLNAIDEKRRKLQRYHESKVHPPDAPFVVAVNAARVPSARLELPLPRIVRALFGIGHLEVRVALESLEILGASHGREEAIKKRGTGADVRTDGFLSPGPLTGVSAVLYSCTDSVNRPTCLGGDFVVVHNPHATVPLEPGYLPAREEYVYREGDVICIPGSLARDV